MRVLLLLVVIFCSLPAFSQVGDTAFSIRGNSCNCIFREEGEERKIFDKAQQAPSFPGGDKAWKKFVKDSLTVEFKGEKSELLVNFVVHPDGSLSDIRNKSSGGDDKFPEAKNLLLRSGKWCPGMQNGRCVRAYHTIVFKF